MDAKLKTALLVVDVQPSFWTGNSLIRESFPSFPTNVARLLTLCRDRKATNVSLIVHIRAVYSQEVGSKWRPYFTELFPSGVSTSKNMGAEDFAQERVYSEEEKLKNPDFVPELVLEKPNFDGFLNTNLEGILTSFGIQQTLLCGLVTSSCVQNTAHGAFARGLRPVVVVDACGDRNHVRHNAALELYGNYLYKLTTVDELYRQLLPGDAKNRIQEEMVAFIGTGVMGQSMCGHIMNKGYKVFVYNRTKTKAKELIERGAIWCDSAAQAVKNANIVITIVGYPHDVEQTYLEENTGIIHHAKAGTVCIDMTTSSPLLAKKIHAAAGNKGIRTLDAPVSGGDVGAKAAKLVIMVGGDKEAFAQAMPLFAAMGTNISLQGGPGAGQFCKMSNQIAVSVGMIAWCESLSFAKKAGLDPFQVQNAIKGGAAASYNMTTVAPRALNGDYAAGFYVKHIIKDMKICLECAKDIGMDLPGVELALKKYDELSQQEDFSEKGTQALWDLYK